MTTSIIDNTVNPLVVTTGQTLTAFDALQVTDTVGSTETVTISLGYNYYSYYSPNADSARSATQMAAARTIPLLIFSLKRDL